MEVIFSYIGETGRNLNTRLAEHNDEKWWCQQSHCWTSSTEKPLAPLTLKNWYTDRLRTNVSLKQMSTTTGTLQTTYSRRKKKVKNFTQVSQPISSCQNWPIDQCPQTRLITCDSKDNVHSGCRNVSHQQQFFSELPSHFTNWCLSVHTYLTSLLTIVYTSITCSGTNQCKTCCWNSCSH